MRTRGKGEVRLAVRKQGWIARALSARKEASQLVTGCTGCVERSDRTSEGLMCRSRFGSARVSCPRLRFCVLPSIQTFAVSILAYHVCDHENSARSNNGLCATGRTLARRGSAHKRSSTGAHFTMTLTGLNPAQQRTAKAKEAIGRRNFNGILKGKTLIKSSTPQRDYHIALGSEKHEAVLDEREPGTSDEFSRKMSGRAPLNRTERVWPRRAAMHLPYCSSFPS